MPPHTPIPFNLPSHLKTRAWCLSSLALELFLLCSLGLLSELELLGWGGGCETAAGRQGLGGAGWSVSAQTQVFVLHMESSEGLRGTRVISAKPVTPLGVILRLLGISLPLPPQLLSSYLPRT